MNWFYIFWFWCENGVWCKQPLHRKRSPSPHREVKCYSKFCSLWGELANVVRLRCCFTSCLSFWAYAKNLRYFSIVLLYWKEVARRAGGFLRIFHLKILSPSDSPFRKGAQVKNLIPNNKKKEKLWPKSESFVIQ